MVWPKSPLTSMLPKSINTRLDLTLPSDLLINSLPGSICSFVFFDTFSFHLCDSSVCFAGPFSSAPPVLARALLSPCHLLSQDNLLDPQDFRYHSMPMIPKRDLSSTSLLSIWHCHLDSSRSTWHLTHPKPKSDFCLFLHSSYWFF